MSRRGCAARRGAIAAEASVELDTELAIGGGDANGDNSSCAAW